VRVKDVEDVPEVGQYDRDFAQFRYRLADFVKPFAIATLALAYGSVKYVKTAILPDRIAADRTQGVIDTPYGPRYSAGRGDLV
jgi:hypothetical protein